MAFNSFSFWLVFPFIFGLYWIIPDRFNQARKVFLVLVSYIVYMNWRPSFALVLLGVTLITFCGGHVLDKQNEKKKKKHYVCLFSVLGLLPLLLFKYYNFVNDCLSDWLASIGLKFYMPGLNWAIPVGISFFTFQAVGYMLDVYHGRIEPENKLLDYVLFVSFFPQILSGPISRADELLPQIKTARVFNYNQAVSGLKYLLWGLFLKVVLADRIGIYVDTVFSAYNVFSGTGCLLACVLYSIQIYADFAGYSLIAVGIAKTLGINLIDNFNRPYFSTSVTIFWKRWHISLTRWLTQQVYIPLGGSRCSRARNYFNIIVTFLVSGIWHGANWTFIIWGMLHGVIQVIEKAFGFAKKDYKGIAKICRVILTFLMVTLAWVFFRSSSIREAFGVIGHFFAPGGKTIVDVQTLLYIVCAIIPLFLFEFCKELLPLTYVRLRSIRILRWTSYLMIFAMIVLLGVHDSSSFIYVSF